MAHLKVLTGEDAGKIIPLEGDRIVFGRQPSCAVILEDGAVSRQHAQIVQSHGSYYVKDLRSRNGTQVNETDVTEPTLLKESDIVRVCEYTYLFHDDSSNGELSDDTAYVKPKKKKVSNDAIRATANISVPIDPNDPEGDSDERSSIISRIDARSGSGVRLSVKPEVKLRAILEIGKHLSNVLNIDDVLPSILDALFQIFPQADQAFVLLKEEEEEDEPRIRACRNRRKDDDSMSVSKTIVSRAMRSGEAILSADASEDSRFVSSESLAGLQIRSMMCVPLITQAGQRLGVIQITTFDLRSKFTEDDLDLLVNIATQCTLAIENANMHQTLLNRQNLERDLEIAMQVQIGFLPNKPPDVKDYDFADYYEAAQHVGGDYYDYIELPDGRIAVTVADVAGKGVPAALLMARLYSAARYHLLTKKTPAEAMSGLNSEIATSGLGHRFITCAMAVLEPAKHEIVLVSAGHLPPIARDLEGNVEQIDGDDTGLPLGIIPDQTFVQSVHPLKQGDTWVLYTDGVTEAMKPNREIYGSKRLQAFIKSGPLEVDALVKATVDDVNRFAGGHSQSDDLCIVAFQRVP
ncbi:MAG: SpoIIE family protein phosphatase [Planctomycetota bacterium]|nr:SpoIIE family protein phosphatase [Planctomycetota bacterium]